MKTKSTTVRSSASKRSAPVTIATPHISMDPIDAARGGTAAPVSVPGAAPAPTKHDIPVVKASAKARVAPKVTAKPAAKAKAAVKPMSKRVR